MQWLWQVVKSHIGEFKKGFYAGFVAWGGILFSRPHFLDNLLVEYILKFIGALALAVATGLGNSLAADFYKEIKSRIKKRKDAKDKKEIDDGKRKERAA